MRYASLTHPTRYAATVRPSPGFTSGHHGVTLGVCRIQRDGDHTPSNLFSVGRTRFLYSDGSDAGADLI
jgi:hypothetical protein